MIFAPLPSLALAVVLTLSQIALLLLVVGLVALSISRRFRAFAGRHRWVRGFSLGILGVFGLPFVATQLFLGVYILGGAIHHYVLRRTTLDAPRVIAGQPMPAGTRLVLREPDEPASFRAARFPKPVSVYGFRASRMERHFRSVNGAQGHVPDRATVYLAVDQSWAGWRCRAGTPVALDLHADGSPGTIRRCVLAADQQADGIRLPAGSALRASEGARYVSGRRGADRWIIDTADDRTTIIAGARLTVRLALDADRRVLSAGGALTAPFSLGPMHYPEGTAVRLTFDGARPRPARWLFSPSRGAVARRDDGPDVDFGWAVAHDRNGRVTERLTNEAAGFRHIVPLR
ncbi:hypothetical protein [Salinisphaera sp. Q1T1-3]|uniref:hypothetical protein n=1 Tax=Salinisphaera sp. Q1T1-3 TaxID=2321229 RepID=UPI000E71E8A7|nr:hypothetical protein [Salinisphaera sp. Q1T1-3]RJS91508.1 hypothetical protein D3260_15265 [Salinisphaera sp. Q1T1-3]